MKEFSHGKVPLPSDYDSTPDRFRANVRATAAFSTEGDVHQVVADRIRNEGLEPVLEVGCGNGRLLALLDRHGIPRVGLDQSPTMLAEVGGETVLADATAIPFDDSSFGAVAALYMLYHLSDPLKAISECHRALKPDGLFVAAAPSRSDMPELHQWIPKHAVSTFDAESGPGLIGGAFSEIEIEAWDGPYILLPDRNAAVDYMTAFEVPPTVAEEAATTFSYPKTITKRGALIYARKSSAK